MGNMVKIHSFHEEAFLLSMANIRKIMTKIGNKIIGIYTGFIRVPLALIFGLLMAIGSLIELTPNANAQMLYSKWLNDPLVILTTNFPVSRDRMPHKTIKISTTAYNSLPNQTDTTPFQTADGTQVRDGIVATNFLPMGTRVKFPDIYGDKEFVVKDRMNARYFKHIDIWMEDLSDAREFGNKYTALEIY